MTCDNENLLCLSAAVACVGNNTKDGMLENENVIVSDEEKVDGNDKTDIEVQEDSDASDGDGDTTDDEKVYDDDDDVVEKNVVVDDDDNVVSERAAVVESSFSDAVSSKVEEKEVRSKLQEVEQNESDYIGDVIVYTNTHDKSVPDRKVDDEESSEVDKNSTKENNDDEIAPLQTVPRRQSFVGYVLDPNLPDILVDKAGDKENDISYDKEDDSSKKIKSDSISDVVEDATVEATTEAHAEVKGNGTRVSSNTTTQTAGSTTSECDQDILSIPTSLEKSQSVATLGTVATNETDRNHIEVLRQKCTPQSLVRRLRMSPSETYAKSACHDLRILTRGDPVAATDIVQAGGTRAVIQAMKRHMNSREMQVEACAALCNLGCTPDGRISVSDSGGKEVLFEALVMHGMDGNSTNEDKKNGQNIGSAGTNGNVAVVALAALCNLAYDEENRTAIIKQEYNGTSGMKIIEKVVEFHRSNLAVKEQGRRVIAALKTPPPTSRNGKNIGGAPSQRSTPTRGKYSTFATPISHTTMQRSDSDKRHGLRTRRSRRALGTTNKVDPEISALTALREVDPELKAIWSGADSNVPQNSNDDDTSFQKSGITPPSSTPKRLVTFDDGGRVTGLDLPQYPNPTLPDQIGILQHLRWLDLTGSNSLTSLPAGIGSRTTAVGLEALILRGCSSLEELPLGLGRMEQLKLLDVDGCFSLKFPPPIVSSSDSSPVNEVRGSAEHIRSCLSILEELQTKPHTVISVLDNTPSDINDPTWIAYRYFCNDESNTHSLYEALTSNPTLESAPTPYHDIDTIWDLVTSSKCQETLKKALLLLGRYRLFNENEAILHESDHSVLLRAIDLHNYDAPQNVHIKIMTASSGQALKEWNGRIGLLHGSSVPIRHAYLDDCIKEYEGEDLTALYERDTTPLEVVDGLSKNVYSYLEQKKIPISNPSKYASNTNLFALGHYNETLRDAMTHRHHRFHKDLPTIRNIVESVAQSLSKLHFKKYVHGNVTSLNIVRSSSLSWTIANFESCCVMGEKNRNMPIYSPYSPPEVLRAAQECKCDDVTAHEAHDLWSLGILLFELLSGGCNFWNTSQNNVEDIVVPPSWSNKSILRKFNDCIDFQKSSLLEKPEWLSALDLSQKLLEPNTEDRMKHFRTGILDVLEHPFVTGEPLKDETFADMKEAIILVTKEKKENINFVNNISKLDPGVLQELRYSSQLYHTGLFEPRGDDVRLPTSFVVTREPLPSYEGRDSGPVSVDFFEDDEDEEFLDAKDNHNPTKRSGVDEGLVWVERLHDLAAGVGAELEFRNNKSEDVVSNIFSSVREAFDDILQSSDQMYLYLIDELTGSPVFGEGYPILIENPVAVVPCLIPLLQVTMRSVALSNGVTGIARMYGHHPRRAVPDPIRRRCQESIELLKHDRSLEDAFGKLAEDIVRLEGMKDLGGTARGSAINELHNLMKKHDPKSFFSGLGRCQVDIHGRNHEGLVGFETGRALWTKLHDYEEFHNAILRRSKDRYREEGYSRLDSRMADFDAVQEDLHNTRRTLEETKENLVAKVKECNEISDSREDVKMKLAKKEQDMQAMKKQMEEMEVMYSRKRSLLARFGCRG